MWVAYASSPYQSKYAVAPVAKKRARKNSTSTDKSASSKTSSNVNIAAISPAVPASDPVSASVSTAAAAAGAATATDSIPAPSTSVLEMRTILSPALDGPPSSTRLKALTNNLRKRSIPDNNNLSHDGAEDASSTTTSSSGHDRRPSWEPALDILSLSRTSSTKSAASSRPSRERPESMQMFGKAMFNRNKGSRRESIPAQSSTGSLIPPEMLESVAETETPALGEGFLPGLFQRRKAVKLLPPSPVEASAKRGRFQISGPFNFQHVTHTQEPGKSVQKKGSKTGLAEQARNAPSPHPGQLVPIPDAVEYDFAEFDSDDSPLEANAHDGGLEDEHVGRRTGKPPVRPPRPADIASPGPIPPPRLSSRNSVLARGIVPAASIPSGMLGVAQQQIPPPLQLTRSSSGGIVHSHPEIVSAPLDDVNWPLTPAIPSTLAEVPEEEEAVDFKMSRGSRNSVRSNNSSLRGSQSVPMLRSLAKAHQSVPEIRRLSGEDAANRAVNTDTSSNITQGLDSAEQLPRESWEEVIDYCYEHEAEADCEYEWSRPSLDMRRPEAIVAPQLPARHFLRSQGLALTTPTSGESSPCSATAMSTPTGPEGALRSPSSSNFSLPLRDGMRLTHLRSESQASTYKAARDAESPLMHSSIDQYFSPDMTAEPADSYDAWGYPAVPDEPNNFKTVGTGRYVPARLSASTTASLGLESTRSGFERHVSTTSTNTNLTTRTSTSFHTDEDEAPGVVKHQDDAVIALSSTTAFTPVAPQATTMSSTTDVGIPHMRSKSVSATALHKLERFVVPPPRLKRLPSSEVNRVDANIAATLSLPAAVISTGTTVSATTATTTATSGTGAGASKRSKHGRSRAMTTGAAVTAPMMGIPGPGGSMSFFPNGMVGGRM